MAEGDRSFGKRSSRDKGEILPEGGIHEENRTISSFLKEDGCRRISEHIDMACFFKDFFFCGSFEKEAFLSAVVHKGFIGHWFSHVVALDFFAAQRAEESCLFFCLHAFCQGMDGEGFRHEDEGAEDFLRLGREIFHEIHVQLQFIEVEILEDVQGRVTASKVIEPAPVSGAVEFFYFFFQMSVIPGKGGFRDFHAEPALLEAEGPDDFFHLL